MLFQTAGIEVSPFLPFFVAMGIALVCSISGISGAFLLLPWQVGFLGYTSPGVSATNQIFNIVACPAGVFRYAREGRLLLPLTLFIVMGTLPGVFIGALTRLTLLSRLDYFLFFVALVLIYLGWRLSTAKKGGQASQGTCRILSFSPRGFSFRFGDETYSAKSAHLIALSLGVGLVGGIYGVGGGAIMTPFLVSFFNFPIHAIAGASLLATFITSLAGTLFYAVLALLCDQPQASPDWLLGLIMGLGGLAGMYCGAALQRFIPAKMIRLFLALVAFGLGSYFLARALTPII